MAVDAGSVYAEVRLRLDQLDKDVRKVENQFRGLQTNQKQRASGFQKLWTSSFAAVAAAGIAAVAGIAKVSKELITAASDAEETANKFNVVFRGVEGAAEAAENLAESYGLSNTASKDLLSSTSDLLQGFGVAKDESLELSTQVQELAVDLASFTNFSGGAEGASQALTKALLGERESVKALGIAITETELAKFAEEQGLVFKELDRGAKAALTLELAYKQSANAIGDFERSQDSFANQIRIAQANIENTKEALGEGLLPFATLAVTTFNDLSGSLGDAASQLADFVTSAEGADKISEVLATIGGSFSVIGEQAKIIFPALKDGLSGALDPLKEAFADVSERAGETGIVFDILGGVTQYATSFFRVLTTAIREQIDFIVQFGSTVVETGNLAVEALKSIFNKERREDLREQAQAVADSWKETGRDFLDVYTETFDALKVEAVSFADNARDNADRLAEAYERGFERVKVASQEALESAGEAEEAQPDPDTETRIENEVELADLIQESARQELIRANIRQQAIDQEAVSYTEWKEEQKRLDEEATASQIENLRKVQEVASTVYGSLTGFVGAYFDFALSRAEKGSEEETKLKKRQFLFNKLDTATQTGIAGAQAAVEAYKALAGIPIVGPALGIAAAAAVGGFTAAQVGFILAQKPPSFAGGGFALPGGGTNAIVAENGSPEMMLNAGTTGEEMMSMFAQKIVEAGGLIGGNIGTAILELDGEVLARSTVGYINRREATVNQASVVEI